MVSERIFSCTCTGTWCYINRRSLVLAQTLEVIRSSLVLAHLHRRVLAQTLDATLQGAGLPGRDHTIRRGGGTGPQTGAIYTYIVYTKFFIKKHAQSKGHAVLGIPMQIQKQFSWRCRSVHTTMIMINYECMPTRRHSCLYIQMYPLTGWNHGEPVTQCH